ncbi:arylsulfatase B-like [Haematobia irritans]|uniref:arylsulfatase B-like n=1 Tax=Haematobia irritans TaxID=7368 RepID=UPI003F508500
MRGIFLKLNYFCFSWFWLHIFAKEFVPPNIVIIVADDMGFDDVSFRGGHEFLTPNIDALAYHGQILNRMYTPPLCTPSRATLLTGLYPIHTGSQHYVIVNEEPWSILDNQTTMAQIFQKHGYSTNLVGKWHLGMGRREFTPTYRGFDYHYGYWGAYIDYYRKRCKMPVSNATIGYDFRRNLEIECTSEDEYVTDLFTSKAERIIMNNPVNKPLFLMVSHLAPHAGNEDDPLQAPIEEIEQFSYIPDVRRRIYAAMISKLDESVGRIVRALDDAKILNNTIIIFYSDNGAPTVGFLSNTGSNWPLKGQKHSPWEGAIRVPGVIWSPLLPNRGALYQQTVYAGDWLPTLAAAANIQLNLKLDGLNLWPDLVTEDRTDEFSNQYRDREIIHMADGIWNIMSYTKGPYKYIKGTTINGQYDRVLSQRNPNVTDPREYQYEGVIRTSSASQSLQKYDTKPLTNERIQFMRLQSKIECGPEGPSCDPLKQECLYNILLDPCEQNNLANKPEMTHILRDIRNRMDNLQLSAIAPKTGGSVWKNDPSRHNCIWSNFLENHPTDYISQCDYHSPPCKILLTPKLWIYLLFGIFSSLGIITIFVILYCWKHYSSEGRQGADYQSPAERIQLNTLNADYIPCPQLYDM